MNIGFVGGLIDGGNLNNELGGFPLDELGGLLDGGENTDELGGLDQILGEPLLKDGLELGLELGDFETKLGFDNELVMLGIVDLGVILDLGVIELLETKLELVSLDNELKLLGWIVSLLDID